MKKIVALLGSPRKESNSAALARKIMDTAAALGAESEVFSLYQLAYSGCIACMGCKKTADECVLQDDLTHVLRAIREADVLIIASPVYFGQVAGPVKSAIDRMYSFLKPTYITEAADRSRLEPGKHCVFIITQGAADAAVFAEVCSPYEHFFGPGWFGFQMHLIRGVGMSAPHAAAENTELMQQAEELARQLLT